MADQNYTHIEILLDRSGSMNWIKSDMEGAYNSFIEEQRKVNGKCTVSLHQFDSGVALSFSHSILARRPTEPTEPIDWYQTLYSFMPVSEVPRLVLSPRGLTPLLDAAGKLINDLGEQLRSRDEATRPGKVIVIIITDGQENDSKEFVVSQIKEMITHQESVYNWQFVFLGANFDTVGEGRKLGLKIGASLSYAANEVGICQMSKSLSDNVEAYRVGSKNAVTFEVEDFKAQEDAGV